MQPQTTTPSPTPQYDFILNDQKQQKPSRFGFLKNLPKPALIIGALGALFIIAILIAALSSRGNQQQPLVSAAGRAQEVSRISALAELQSKDPDTKGLAAIAEAALASQQSQISGYLKDTGTTVNPSALLAYQDKTTDEELAQGLRDNKLEEIYSGFLKENLGKYKSDLQSAAKTVGKNGQALIEALLKSTDALLSSPQLGGVTGN